jgi:hypothetical protein
MITVIVLSSGFTVGNTPPSVHTLEPLSPKVNVDVEDSVDFVITTADHDNEDTLSIYWYVDGVEVDYFSGSETYTFDADQYNIGEHYVEVLVTDGKENVTRGWTVTVREDNSQEQIYGLTWDQWDLITTIIGVVFFIIIVVVIARVVFHVGSKKMSDNDEMDLTKRK